MRLTVIPNWCLDCNTAPHLERRGEEAFMKCACPGEESKVVVHDAVPQSLDAPED